MPRSAAIFLSVSLIGGCNMGNRPADSDSFCRELLETGGPQEVDKWIHEGKNTLGELGRDESISLADGIYKAVAPHVYAVEIENTGKLIIELSDDAAARKRAFRLGWQNCSRAGLRPRMRCWPAIYLLNA